MPVRRSNKNQTLRTAKSDSSLQRQKYDRKTGRKIFYDCVVCVLDRTLVDTRQIMKQEKLSDILISHLNKRRSHQAHLICYEDEIVFRKKNFVAKSLFRDRVLYKDIEHYFLCAEYPDIFMISVKSEFPFSSYCETYKCKNAADAKQLCEAVFLACQAPDKKLREFPSTIDSQSLAASPIRSKSTPHIDTQTSADVMNRSMSHSLNDVWTSPRLHVESPIPSPIHSPINSPIQSSMLSPGRSPLYSYQSPVQTSMNRDSMFKPLVVTPVNTANTSAYVSDPNDMTTNTTYFDYDPVHGPQINEVGPIYMFMVRHPSQHDMTHLAMES
ncbi:unnamed protein product [Schistosoma turkestanicum]|nr:unnamed protein product [Schistosoma turkestanicum]